MSSNDIIYQSKGALIAFLGDQGFLTASAGAQISGTPSDNEVAVWTGATTVEGDSNLTWNGTTLDIGGTLTVDGNTTLGDASGDSVTINAQTIDVPNITTGTDNSVVVYNGSSMVTDEIDSKVWAGNLIDYTGTPVNNQLAIWTDMDTVEGDSSLTWDGSSLTATGRLNASTAVQTPLLEYTDGTDALNIVSDGTISFAYGNVGSPSVQTTGLESDGDGEWTKILTHGALANYETPNVVALVTLNPMAFSAGGGVGMHWEFMVTARWGRDGGTGAVYTDFTDVTAEALNSAALDSWDPTTDIILTYNGTTSAEVWIKGLSNQTSCEVSILGGTSMKPVSGNDTTSWQVAPYRTSTWDTFTSLGTNVYGTWVSKTLTDLTVDGNTTLGDASGDSLTINAQTIDLANVAAGTDNTVLIYNGSTVLTDEIDSRVWGSTLVDASNGTDNELAIFTDSNSVEGDSNLTWDGSTLAATGVINASTSIQTALIEYTDGDDAITIEDAGTILLPNGRRSSPSVTTTDTESDGDGEWTKILTHPALRNYEAPNVIALVTLNPMGYYAAGLGEHYEFIVTARWARNATAGAYPQHTDISVTALQRGLINGWDPATDIILTYNGVSSAEVWIKGLSNYTSCEVTILGGSSDQGQAGSSFNSDGWRTVTREGSTWDTFSSLGTDVYGTWAGYSQDSWTAPSLGSNWANYGGVYQTVGYMKDSIGFIHVRGLVKATGAVSSTIFTLPTGYRPSLAHIFAINAYDDSAAAYDHGRCDIDSNGAVKIIAPTPASGDWFALEGILFDTQS